ncbi:MAG TPA: L,D-transpeptidase [Blastocatellia bacterium]|nr:L,D-transpeptidase [Blastocatellia bacterium]
MVYSPKKFVAFIAAVVAALWIQACGPVPNNSNQSAQATATGKQEPVIEATPVKQGENNWLVAGSDSVTLNVSALGAKSVRILYRPIDAGDRVVALKKNPAAADSANGTFTTQVKMPPDFAGDVWAEVTYADGSKKQTKPIQLSSADNAAIAEALAKDAAHGNESEREDKFTGGRIQTAALAENQPDIKITVDVPAFRLTLWQNGKEVKTYEIGVGRKEFPLAIGMRRAGQIIWNPEWVPPDSDWVLESHKDVEPGEHIDADDPRNPLGKIKVPLGEAYLIHQAAHPTDLGHLVSHGCVRMLQSDLYDLTEKIMAARGWPVSREKIEQSKNNTDRLVARLSPPVPVDINYDTQVIEGGVLRIYPDVYDRNTNTVENLRAELQSSGVDAARLDDATLKQMLDRANANQLFAVNVGELTTGNALAAGQQEPLTSQSKVAKRQASGGSSRHARRR